MTEEMTSALPEQEPGVATAHRGIVILDGPDGVAVSMIPSAARETARRLIDAADEAEAQERDAED